ncbi:hypothetical protein MNBD_UNCLBAC01-1219, partial [hydrothermal vent metagenome]
MINITIKKNKLSLLHRLFSVFTAFAFTVSSLAIPTDGYAQPIMAQLPNPGLMVSLSSAYVPPLLMGVEINPESPLQIDFLMGQGEEYLIESEQQEEYTHLIKYFMASLTTPEEDMWVNLSPYEKDRIIPEKFGQTEMGIDLLAQDYLLKQLTASLMYPEDELGSEFWQRVYQKAQEQYGTTEIPVNTFNKVWIVPEKAIVHEDGNTAWVLYSRLKVMLEEDYLAMEQNSVGSPLSQKGGSNVTTQIIRDILIPEIEHEVNEGKHFAPLRQIMNSMILATWYKQTLKESVLGQVYVDQGKVSGVKTDDEQNKMKIYDQYTEAFKKGVFNYIKEDYDPATKEIIPRKYFSGGFHNNLRMKGVYEKVEDLGSVASPIRTEVIEDYRAASDRGIDRVTSEFDAVDSASSALEEQREYYQKADVQTLVTDYYLAIKKGIDAIDLNLPDEDIKAVYNQVTALVEPLSHAVNQVTDKKLWQVFQTAITTNNIPSYLISLDGPPTVEIIRNVLSRIGHEKFQPETQELIDSIVLGNKEELANNEQEEKVLSQLGNSIKTTHFSHFLPELILEENFGKDKEKIKAYLFSMSRQAQFDGSMNPDTKLIQMHDFGNTLRTRKTLEHELTHLLSDMDIYHIPEEWENITYAVDVMVHVQHFGDTLLEGEESLKDTMDEYGPAVVQLYQRGKELGLKNETGFIIKPGISDNKAGYFAMDYLLMEAREIYEQLGLSADIFQMLDHNASYAAQMSVGVVLAGIFMGMSQKDENFKPKRALRDFFDVLYERYGDEYEDDVQWQNFYKDTLAQTQKYSSAKAGRILEFVEKENGFWVYQADQENPRKGMVEYVKTDFKWRAYDGVSESDFDGKAKAAYERILGQVTMLFANQDSDIVNWKEQVPEDIRNHPAFNVLWNTLIIPLVIDFSQFDEEPSGRWVKRVLRDRYDIGNEWVERGLYNGLPFYLQYLDSLLYMRYHYNDQTQKTTDLRINNAKVSEAIEQSLGSFDQPKEYGWGKLLYFSHEIQGTQFSQTITNTIWPQYEVLYDEAVEKEKLFQAYQDMMEEEKQEMVSRQSFEQRLTQALMQQIQEYMESLSEEEREEIQKEAQQNVNQDMQNFGNFSQPAGAMGNNSSEGKQGEPKPGSGFDSAFSQVGQGQPQGPPQPMDPKDMEQVVKNLEQQLENLSDGMKQLSDNLSDIRDEANDIQTDGVSPENNQQAQETAGNIQDQAKEIQNMANEALNEGRNAAVQGEQQNQIVDTATNNLPSSEDNKEAQTSSENLKNQTQELAQKLQELQDKANELLQSANNLSDTVNNPESSSDGSKIQNAVQNLENALNNVNEQVGQASGTNRDIQRNLGKLEESISKIQEALNQAQPSPSSQGESGDQGEPQEGAQAGSEESSEGKSSGSETPSSESEKFTPTPPQIHIPNASSLKDEFEDDLASTNKIETAKVEDFDPIKAKQRQDDLIKNKTGLSPQEYEEFKSWYKMEIDENGITVSVEELIKELTKAMRLFLLPHKGLNLQANLDSGPILHDPVSAIVGDPGFATIKKKYPQSFYFTIMGDISRSMGFNVLEGTTLTPIDFERIIQFVFINSFLNHNKERVTKGKTPLAFEIGLWSDDVKTPPMISHETTRKKNFKKERVMYDIWQATKPTGVTSYADNLRHYLTRLINAQSADKEGVRVLMVISDEQVYDREKSEILGLIELAKKNGIYLFVLPMGNAQQIQETKNLHQDHPEQIIEPSPYATLISRSMDAFVSTIGGNLTRGRDWRQVVDELSKRASSSIAIEFGEKKAIDGYEYFKSQTINGWPYLVFEREGDETEYFPQGFGGNNVPLDVITETEETIEQILKVLRAMYRPNQMPNFPYSPDGKYLTRFAHNGNIEINILKKDGSYKYLLDFDPFELMDDKGAGLFETVQQKLQIQLDKETNQVQINQNTDHFVDVEGLADLNLQDWFFYEHTSDRVVAYHRKDNAVLILTRKAKKDWKILHQLTLQKEDRGESWEPQYVNFSGDPGTGKSKTARVVAHLLNLPLIPDTGHADLTVEDVTTAHRSINNKATGYEPSMLNVIKHQGWIGLYEEVHKFDPDVWNSIKSTISEKMHQWPITGKDGVTRLEKMPDHPLARLFTTGNEKRDGIEGQNWTHNNGPVQERKENVHFYRQSPQSEVQWQTDKALQLADKLKKYENDPQGRKDFEERLKKDIAKFVKIGANLYLRFKGYNAEQQEEIHRDWQLIDPMYLAAQMAMNPHIAEAFPDAGPAFETGEFLKRTPSPRVIENIIEHFVQYEKDWQYRPLTVIQNYFNFEAEIDDGSTYEEVIKDFEERFEDKDYPYLELNQGSFKVVGKSLIMAPLNPEYWDEVEVPLHSRAAIRLGALPKEIREWFGWFDGEEGMSDDLKEFFHQNIEVFYQSLQVHSLGMDLIFVGDPGSGKSTAVDAIQSLLNAPGHLKYNINQQTRVDQITFQKEIVSQGETYYIPQVLARGMNENEEGQVVNFDESSQGRNEMLSFQNNISEYRVIKDPRNNNEPLHAADGFGIIHSINIPGRSDGVNAFPDDFLERHVVFKFNMPPPQVVEEYLLLASKRSILPYGLKRKLNERLIGEQVGTYPDTKEQKYDGIVGLWQNINRKQRISRDILPANREISLRVMQKFVKHLMDRYEPESKKKSSQQILLETFVQAFTLEGETPRETTQWMLKLIDEFEAVHLFSKDADQDAVKIFLDGDEVIVDDLEPFYTPNLKNEVLLKLLNQLQTTLSQTRLQDKLKHLSSEVDNLLDQRAWDEADFMEKLQTMNIIKEVYRTLGIIHDYRSNPDNKIQMSTANLRGLKAVQKKIQQIIVAFDWPAEVLEKTEPLEVSVDLLTKSTEIKSIDESIMRILLFADNAVYITDQLAQLKETIFAIQNNRITNFMNIKSMLEKFDADLFNDIISEIRNWIESWQRKQSKNTSGGMYSIEQLQEVLREEKAKFKNNKLSNQGFNEEYVSNILKNLVETGHIHDGILKLEEMLKDQSRAVRQVAVEVLGELAKVGKYGDISKLEEMLKDQS